MQLLCLSNHFTNEDVKRNYRNLTCCPLGSVIGYPVVTYLLWALYGETVMAEDKASAWALIISSTVMSMLCTVLAVGVLTCMAIALQKFSHLHSKKAFYLCVVCVVLEILTFALIVTTSLKLARDYREHIICGMITVLGIFKIGCLICSLGTLRKFMQLTDPKQSLVISSQNNIVDEQYKPSQKVVVGNHSEKREADKMMLPLKISEPSNEKIANSNTMSPTSSKTIPRT